MGSFRVKAGREMSHFVELPDGLYRSLQNMANETENDVDCLIHYCLESTLKEEGFLTPSSSEVERILGAALSLPEWARPTVSEDAEDGWFLVEFAPVCGSDVRVGVRLFTERTGRRYFFSAVMDTLSVDRKVTFHTEENPGIQEVWGVGRQAIEAAIMEMVSLLKDKETTMALLRDRSEWGWV